MVKFAEFCKELWQKLAFLKIEGQTLKVGDFLNIFLRFWDF